MKTNFTMPYLLVMLLLSVSTVFATNSIIAPPSNDLITNAIDIDQGPFPYSQLAVNFPEATNTNDNPGALAVLQLPQFGVNLLLTAVLR